MQNPLKERHWIARELKCFFLGHDWKFSWSKKVYRDDDILFGAHTVHNSTYWKVKCVRCRLRTQDAWVPWYKMRWMGIKSAMSHYKIFWDVATEENVPLWKKIIGILIGGTAWAFEGFYIYFDRMPWFPLTISSKIHDTIWEWMMEKSDGREEVTN